MTTKVADRAWGHGRTIPAGPSRGTLPPTLATLAEAIMERQRKGEQEALDLTAGLDQ
jgi:hypothetical protein